jgi:hypothetical protein
MLNEFLLRQRVKMAHTDTPQNLVGYDESHELIDVTDDISAVTFIDDEYNEETENNKDNDSFSTIIARREVEDQSSIPDSLVFSQEDIDIEWSRLGYDTESIVLNARRNVSLASSDKTRIYGWKIYDYSEDIHDDDDYGTVNDEPMTLDELDVSCGLYESCGL